MASKEFESRVATSNKYDPQGEKLLKLFQEKGLTRVTKITTGKVFFIKHTAENLDEAQKNVGGMVEMLLVSPHVDEQREIVTRPKKHNNP